MIDKATCIPIIIQKLQNIPVGHCIDLRTYKRNRSVLIVKQSPKEYWIKEDGYASQTMVVEDKKMKKILKKLLKKEFPRSNKIRLYELGLYIPGDTENRNLKKL